MNNEDELHIKWQLKTTFLYTVMIDFQEYNYSSIIYGRK
jgi:hypothetical protein